MRRAMVSGNPQTLNRPVLFLSSGACHDSSYCLIFTAMWDAALLLDVSNKAHLDNFQGRDKVFLAYRTQSYWY